MSARSQRVEAEGGGRDGDGDRAPSHDRGPSVSAHRGGAHGHEEEERRASLELARNQELVECHEAQPCVGG